MLFVADGTCQPPDWVWVVVTLVVVVVLALVALCLVRKRRRRKAIVSKITNLEDQIRDLKSQLNLSTEHSGTIFRLEDCLISDASY